MRNLFSRCTAVFLVMSFLVGVMGISALAVSTTASQIGSWTQVSDAGGSTDRWTVQDYTYTSTEVVSADSSVVGDTAANTVTDPLGNSSITLHLTPGNTTAVTAATADHLQVLSELTGGSSEHPAHTTRTSTTNEDGSVVTVVTDTTALYGSDNTTVIGYQVTVTTTTESDGAVQVHAPVTTTTFSAPTGYVAGTQTTTLSNGTQVVITTELTDEDGIVVGYEITTVTTTRDDAVAAASGAALPERPVASVSTDLDTGETTTVTVTDLLDAQDTVTGYQVTTVVTDADGSQCSRIVETLYAAETTVNGNETTVTETRTIVGTVKTVTTSTTRTVDVAVTEEVRTETWKLQDDTDGLSYVYTGQMSSVTANSGNGTEATQSLQSSLSELAEEEGNMLFDMGDQAGTPQTDFDYTNHAFQYIDGIIGSTVYGNGVAVFQYELTERGEDETQSGSGRRHYVLCADLSVSPQSNKGYNMENVEDATYYTASDAAHIKVIALNGYWGTTSGIGSLDAVQQLLQNSTTLSNDVIDLLTPGMALTATQAAIWQYGNSDTSHTYDIREAIHLGNDTLSEDQQTVLFALYDLLVNMDPNGVTDTGTTIINAQHFAQKASIVLKSKSDAGLYTADISFTLAAVPTADDDLALTVTVRDKDGNVISNTTDQLPSSTAWTDPATGNSGRCYTLENVQLPADATVTLKLSGTQTLEQGVYLYTADSYDTTQTFVGIASGTRSVNLSVDLSFQETAPTASFRHTTSTQVVKQDGTRTDVQEHAVTYALTQSSGSTTPSPEISTAPSPDPDTTPDPEPTTSPSPEPDTTPVPEPDTSPSPDPTVSPSPEPDTTPVPEPTTTPSPTPSPAPEEPSDRVETELPDGSVEDIFHYPDGVEVDLVTKPDHTITATITVPENFSSEQIAIPIDLGPNDGTVTLVDITDEDTPLISASYVNGSILLDVDGPMELEILDDLVPLGAAPTLAEDGTPYTGDSSHRRLWLLALLLSGCTLLGLGIHAAGDRRRQ